MNFQTRMDGFNGSILLAVPGDHLHRDRNDRLLNQLYVNAIGYYPSASGHEVHRKKGSDTAIFIYCTDGKGWVEIDGERYAIQIETAVVLPAGVPHAYGADEDDPWTIQWLHFGGKHAKSWLRLFEQKKGKLPFLLPSCTSLDQLFNDMITCLEHGYSTGSRLQANSVLAHYFSLIVLGQILPVSRNSDSIEKVIKWLNENSHQRISLKEMAHRAGFSRSHFSGLFRLKTGYAPLSYVNLIRIRKACQYLQLTNLRIGEISRLSGFDDPYYFSRQFTKTMHLSPRAYRQKLNDL